MKFKVKRPKHLKFNDRNQTRTEVARAYLTEFCSKSTIHGIRYFTEQRRHWTERCWWIIAFNLSLCICGLSIHSIWLKWNENPVTMSFTESKIPASAIPFPTVTICPVTKTYKNKLDINSIYYSHQDQRFISNLSDTERARVMALVQLCPKALQDRFTYDEKFANEMILSVIKGMAPKLMGTLLECKWQYQRKLCHKMFAPTFTELGLCFAFNTLNSHEFFTNEVAPEMLTVNHNRNITNFTIDEGYKDDLSKNSYPFRVNNLAKDAGLSVIITLFARDLEYICQGSFQGYNIFLHSPGESVRMSKNAFRLPLLEEAEIAIKPQLVVTSMNLLSYNPNRRRCFFNNERQLRFFRFYGQQNCENECLANFTLQQCGCVKFSMPRAFGTKICGAASIKCYWRAERKLFEDEIVDSLGDVSVHSFREQCNCLPACTTVSYSADIDRTKFNWLAMLNASNFPSTDYAEMRPSTLAIFFQEPYVTMIKRVELYTYSNFLAVCGGLLGLFLGVSVLSIIEFIYFSTLRLYWQLKQWRRENEIVSLQSKPINRYAINLPQNFY